MSRSSGRRVRIATAVAVPVVAAVVLVAVVQSRDSTAGRSGTLTSDSQSVVTTTLTVSAPTETSSTAAPVSNVSAPPAPTVPPVTAPPLAPNYFRDRTGTAYNGTGAAGTFTVPTGGAGYAFLEVELIGGAGGSSFKGTALADWGTKAGGTGGSGARVVVRRKISGIESYAVYLGGNGKNACAISGTKAVSAPSAGGWNGGGAATGCAGTGGGATEIRNAAGVPEVVAGGGGGGGAGAYFGAGGNGGDAGDGLDGRPGSAAAAGGGGAGLGGSTSAGGQGGGAGGGASGLSGSSRLGGGYSGDGAHLHQAWSGVVRLASGGTSRRGSWNAAVASGPLRGSGHCCSCRTGLSRILASDCAPAGRGDRRSEANWVRFAALGLQRGVVVQFSYPHLPVQLEVQPQATVHARA